MAACTRVAILACRLTAAPCFNRAFTPALQRFRAIATYTRVPLRPRLATDGSGSCGRFVSSTPDEDGDEIVHIEVPRSRLSVSFARSSGAGGQNVNKVNTKAELRFQVYGAAWLPDEVRLRLLEANPTRINAKGEFFVSSERHRTQKQNIDDAFRKLQHLVDVACIPPKERNIRTGLSSTTKQRRVEIKRRRSDVKSRRRGGGSDD